MKKMLKSTGLVCPHLSRKLTYLLLLLVTLIGGANSAWAEDIHVWTMATANNDDVKAYFTTTGSGKALNSSDYGNDSYTPTGGSAISSGLKLDSSGKLTFTTNGTTVITIAAEVKSGDASSYIYVTEGTTKVKKYVAGTVTEVTYEGGAGNYEITKGSTEAILLYVKVADTPSYTITYNTNGFGGSIADVSNVTALPNPLPSPTFAGKVVENGNGFAWNNAYPTEFLGWFTDAELTQAAVAGATITENTTLYAKWSGENVVRLGYNVNGGTGDVPATTVHTKNANVTVAGQGSISRAGYTFDGWQIDRTGTVYNEGSTFSLNGNRTLYAKWAPQSYHIKYREADNDATITLEPSTHTYGTPTTLGIPVKSGYAFAGWYTNKTLTGDPITVLGATDYTADITVYAKWTVALSCDGTWNANQSSRHALVSGKSMHVTFHNKANDSAVDNWENWILVAGTNDDKNVDYMALRADNYDIHNSGSNTTREIKLNGGAIDWGTFLSDMKAGADVDLYVSNSGSKLYVHAVTTANGNKYDYTAETQTSDSEVYISLMGQNCVLSDINFSTPETAYKVSATPSDDKCASATMTNTLGMTVTNDTYVQSGEKITFTATPADPSYTFEGWKVGSEVRDAQNPTTVDVTFDINVTASYIVELKDILVAELNSENSAESRYDVGGLIGGTTATYGIRDTDGKLNGTDSYIEIKLDAGNFKAGDVITITSNSNKGIVLRDGTHDSSVELGTTTTSTTSTFTLPRNVETILIIRNSTTGGQNPSISKIVVSRAKVAASTEAAVEYETVVMQAGSNVAYTPKVTVKSNGVTLTASDYTVSYASNDATVVPNGAALGTIDNAQYQHTAEITATITPTDEDTYLPTTVKFNVIVLPNDTYTGATVKNEVTPTIFSGSTLYYGTTLGGNVYVKEAKQGNGGLWTKWQGTTEGDDCRIRFKVETVPMQVIVTNNTNSNRYMAYGKYSGNGTYSAIGHGEAGSSSFVFTITEAGEYGIAGAKTNGDNQYDGADLYLKSISFTPVTAGKLPAPVFSVDAVTGKFTITNYLGDDHDYYYTLDGSDPSDPSSNRIELTWDTTIDKPTGESYPYTYSSIKLYAEKVDNGTVTKASDVAEISNVIISQYERIYFANSPKTMTVGQRDTYNGSWIRADKKDGTKGVYVGEAEIDKNPVITTGNEFITIAQANETKKRLVVNAIKSNSTDNAQARITVTIEGVTSEEGILNIERGKVPVHIFVDHISLNSGNKGQQLKAATEDTQAMTLNEAKLRYVIYNDGDRTKVQDNGTSSSKQKYSVAVTRKSGDYENVDYASGKFTLKSTVTPGKEVWTATFTSKESDADVKYKPMSIDFDIISGNYAFAYNKDVPGAGGSSRDADDKDGNVALHMFAGANPAGIWDGSHNVYESPWRANGSSDTRVGQEKTLTASTESSGNNYGDMHGWEQYTMSTPKMTMNSMTEKHGPGTDCALGFKYESYNYAGSRDEFAVPVMGTFYRFTPLYDGYMAVYMLANGNIDDGDVKNSSTFSSVANRRIYFVDNKGSVTPVTNAVMQDRATLNPGFFKINPNTISADRLNNFKFCVNELLQNWESWGNPTSLKPGTTYDDVNWEKWANLFNDKEGIHFKPIKNDDGSFSFIYKAYVRFVVPVEANKVVYVSPTGTKTSLAAVEFFKTQSDAQAPVNVDFYNGTGATSDSTPYTYNPASGSVASTGFDESVAMTNGAHYNVTLKDRSFKAGHWYSFCMPFDIPETQIHEIFGEDAQTLHFHSVTKKAASEGGLEVSVNFIQHFYDQTIAGHPIFIRTGIPEGKNVGDVCWPVGSVTFTNLIYQPNATLLETHNNGYTFKGSYTPTTMAANTYFLNGNALYHVAGEKTTAGNRAWIEGPASETGAKAVMATFGLMDDMEGYGEATGIECIEDRGFMPGANIIKHSDVIYNLGGQIVGRGADLNSLPDGVYVINGKKVIK